jgi:hypothetical protein
MASDEAWNAGWNLGSGYAKDRFALKQGRADEQRAGNLAEFDTAIEGLKKKYAAALKTDDKGNTIETPASLQAKYALTQVFQARNAFLNPTKGPGLLQKAGEKIGEALHWTKKPQEQSFTVESGRAGEPSAPVLRHRPGTAPVADAGVPITLPAEPAYQQEGQVTRQPAVDGAAATSTTPTMKLTPGAAEPGIEGATLPALPAPAPGLPSRTQTVKRPAYSQKQLRDMVQRSQQAQQETELATAGAPNAPLSPEQQAVQSAEAGAAGNLATMKSSMTAFDALYPHATPEERQEFQDKLMGKTFGTAQKAGVLKPLPGSKPYKKPDGVYYQSMLNSLTGAITAEPMPEDYTPPAGRPLSPGAQAFQAMVKRSSGQTLSPEEEAALTNYPKYVYETSTAPRVAGYTAGAKARAEFQNVPIVNPDNPQETIYTTAGEARRGKHALPSSVGYQVNMAGYKGLIPRHMGDNIVAFSTTRGHIRLLGTLIDGLGTGQIPSLNALTLAWSRAIGKPVPAEFEAVKDSLKGELAKAYSGTSGTIPELAEIGKMIDEAKSPQALRGALKYANDTMRVRETNIWKTARMAGLNMPGKTTGAPQAGGGRGISVTAPDNSIHTFPNQAAANQFKRAAGIR